MNTIALYLRLSSEDNDLGKNKTESDSISNQRKYIKGFLEKQPDLQKARILEFCDDGYSGLTFHRPEVTRLLALAKERKINCIIVKDFSRFGRNYVEAGKYLEQVFPFLGIRFISINDCYDSQKNDTFGIEIGFKSLVYELYSKDISIKIKRGKRMTAQKGYFNGPCPPYGYEKSPENPHRLIIDKEAARIVQEIFCLRSEGLASRQIALWLNEKRILSPAAYKGNSSVEKEAVWTERTINAIIQNQCYLGHMIGYKTVIPKIRQKRIAVPRGEQIQVNNTHEPIVSAELFQKANDTYKKIQRKKYEKKSPIFQKKVYCRGCGRLLTLQQRKSPYFICRLPRVTKENHQCFSERLYEADLIRLAEILLEKTLCLAGETKNNEINFKAVIKKEEAKKKKIHQRKIELFEEYSLEKISAEDYMKAVVQLDKEAEEIEKSIQQWREKKNALCSVLDNKCVKPLTSEVVNSFIQAISIWNTKQIELAWSYSDIYQSK